MVGAGAVRRLCLELRQSNPGVTTQDFGGDAQYGTPNVARYGGTIISQPMKNPEFNGSCSKKILIRVTRPAWTYTPARSATRSRCQRESPNAWALACARLRKKWRSCS